MIQSLVLLYFYCTVLYVLILCATASQELIQNGALRADVFAGTLVPHLLQKADRMRRGKQRTGSSIGPTAGLMELGFLLGGALKNPGLQKAFGISRNQAKHTMCPLLCPFLPRFFCAEREMLQDNVTTSLGLLRNQDYYQLVRDEVVFARSFNVIYGMSHLLALGWIIFVFFLKAGVSPR